MVASGGKAPASIVSFEDFVLPLVGARWVYNETELRCYAIQNRKNQTQLLEQVQYGAGRLNVAA